MLGDRYRLIDLLGKGGMGEVYRADDLELGQVVALKFLPERVATNPLVLDRFRSEVRIARDIAHPGVCRVYDISQVDGHVFLSMELVDGEDLAHVLARMGRPTEEKAVELARELCLGLGAAHDSEVIHRDLKPANVMIDGRGRARIMDFGLAGLVDELQAQPERAGTPLYMAPEQLAEGRVSVESDIYSLGLVLYELFTGQRPFEARTMDDIRAAHENHRIARPSSVTNAMNPAIERVILKCLSKDPAERPHSAYAVLAALPGADPLVAAMAAGQTPSPELVADSGKQGVLSVRTASTLLAVSLVGLLVVGAFLDHFAVPPANPQATLEVRMQDILESLGYDDLPAYSAQHAFRNQAYLSHLAKSDETKDYAPFREADWPPRYLFYKRWSGVPVAHTNFHVMFVGLRDPPLTTPGSVSLAVDDTGRLLALAALPKTISPGDRDREDGSEGAATPETQGMPFDWAAVLELGGFDLDELEPIDPVFVPPVHSDEIRAWRQERPETEGGPVRVQIAIYDGRVVSYEVLWDWNRYGLFAERQHGNSGTSQQLTRILQVLTALATVIIGLYNLRAGRADTRGALVFAGIVFAGYYFSEILTMTPEQLGFLGTLSDLLNGKALSHALVHAARDWLLYLAIEPFVRRYLPQALIGWTRLTSGRFDDPQIGREILIGCAAALCIFPLIACVDVACRWLELPAIPPAYYRPDLLISAGRPTYFILATLALMANYTMTLFFVLLVCRAIGRNERNAVVLLLLYQLVTLVLGYFNGQFYNNPMALIVKVAIEWLTHVIIALRIGLLAAVAATTCTRFAATAPLTLDPNSNAASASFLVMGFILAVNAYAWHVTTRSQR